MFVAELVDDVPAVAAVHPLIVGDVDPAEAVVAEVLALIAGPTTELDALAGVGEAAELPPAIEAALGDGTRWGVTIYFSAEREALETAGGIANALELIDTDAFAVMNSDVYSDYDYAGLSAASTRLAGNTKRLAHLVLVDNPAHNPHGDFGLENGEVSISATDNLTFSGLAAYRRELFASISPGDKKPLAPLLQQYIRAGRVSGEHFAGRWADIGTPERLATINDLIEKEAP